MNTLTASYIESFRHSLQAFPQFFHDNLQEPNPTIPSHTVILPNHSTMRGHQKEKERRRLPESGDFYRLQYTLYQHGQWRKSKNNHEAERFNCEIDYYGEKLTVSVIHDEFAECGLFLMSVVLFRCLVVRFAVCGLIIFGRCRT